MNKLNSEELKLELAKRQQEEIFEKFPKTLDYLLSNGYSYLNGYYIKEINENFDFIVKANYGYPFGNFLDKINGEEIYPLVFCSNKYTGNHTDEDMVEILGNLELPKLYRISFSGSTKKWAWGSKGEEFLRENIDDCGGIDSYLDEDVVIEVL